MSEKKHGKPFYILQPKKTRMKRRDDYPNDFQRFIN